MKFFQYLGKYLVYRKKRIKTQLFRATMGFGACIALLMVVFFAFGAIFSK